MKTYSCLKMLRVTFICIWKFTNPFDVRILLETRDGEYAQKKVTSLKTDGVRGCSYFIFKSLLYTH